MSWVIFKREIFIRDTTIDKLVKIILEASDRFTIEENDFNNDLKHIHQKGFVGLILCANDGYFKVDLFSDAKLFAVMENYLLFDVGRINQNLISIKFYNLDNWMLYRNTDISCQILVDVRKISNEFQMMYECIRHTIYDKKTDLVLPSFWSLIIEMDKNSRALEKFYEDKHLTKTGY